jgi:quinone-reactive Ni/Fe-hydrogenase large subunit
MRFTPEQNLIALSHYLKNLEIQRTAAQMMAIFGGKNPHPQSLTVVVLLVLWTYKTQQDLQNI